MAIMRPMPNTKQSKATARRMLKASCKHLNTIDLADRTRVCTCCEAVLKPAVAS